MPDSPISPKSPLQPLAPPASAGVSAPAKSSPDATSNDAVQNMADFWARDFHDEVAQYLTALNLGLRSLRDPGDEAARREKLDRLDRLATTMQTELYAFIDRLRDLKKDGDLMADLNRLASNWAAYGALTVQTRFRNIARLSLPRRVSLGIVSVVKEAVTNAARHANTTTVIVRASTRPGLLRIAVRDRGVGFTETLATLPSATAPSSPGGHGLRGMYENARAISAALLIRSKPDIGTLVLLDVPLTSSPLPLSL